MSRVLSLWRHPVGLCLGLVLTAVVVGLLSGPSRAQEEGNDPEVPPTVSAPEEDEVEGADPAESEGASEEEAGWMDDVDAFFGTYLVTPLQAVLFFDFGTSRWLKARGKWEYADDDGTESVQISEHKGLYRVRLERNGDVTRYTPASLEDLQSNQPAAYALVQEYAQDEYRSGVRIPFVVVWLLAGAIFFTIRMGFINLRAFRHAVKLTKGDYDDPHDTGEVSHFQALSSALSATVGLGNIAGVAIAIGTGGPGATFWMIVIGLLGMSTKFTECTLGQMYRKVDPDGTVSGGPMRYLKDGLAEMGLKPLGSVLAILFAVICIGASLGGGNAFQVGQSLTAIRSELTFLQPGEFPWLYGLVMAIGVGVVIIGGIRSIGAVAGRIVPFMCGAYVLAAIIIIVRNVGQVGPAFQSIFEGAMSPAAMYGGFLGVLVIGIQRAVFSNEAGAGSAAIAHSAAKTEEPVSEGIVALLEPFIDTVVVCTMTALVIIITGVYDNPEYVELVEGQSGAALTSAAFQVGGFVWFKWILIAAVVLFAYSTLISWSYYGERCATRLFGNGASMPYKIVFLVFVFLGSIVTEGNILQFSDLLILGMALPNVLGVAILSGKVKRALDDYWSRYKKGELEVKKE